MVIIGEVKDAAIIGKFTLVIQPITSSWTTGPVLSEEGGSGKAVAMDAKRYVFEVGCMLGFRKLEVC